jgi:hypothetical protein
MVLQWMSRNRFLEVGGSSVWIWRFQMGEKGETKLENLAVDFDQLGQLIPRGRKYK